MKKVGILTFHYAENRNLGAALQTYAITKLYENQMKKVEVLNFIANRLTWKGKILYFLEGNRFSEYSKKFLNISPIKFENKEEINKEYDIFSVGSDQVWRPIWWRNNVKHYFFDFVDDSKKG